ncbi:hypothetical protein ACFY20_39770 [Streptomyces sp. NPDC001312]|uniref:hypothetical protein n=1 Tax=Streptomyces sp. NPDC001312 TaxID=3364561 RepID=UPI003686377C
MDVHDRLAMGHEPLGQVPSKAAGAFRPTAHSIDWTPSSFARPGGPEAEAARLRLTGRGVRQESSGLAPGGG